MDLPEQTAHRLYPLPSGAWLMQQIWKRVLFAHWPVPADLLRGLVSARTLAARYV